MKVALSLRNKEAKLAVVGLGYVGLPLAVEFGKKIKTIGFDVRASRVRSLAKRIDSNGDVPVEDLKAAKELEFTTHPRKIREASFVIVAVPTPVSGSNQPDLGFLESASRLVGQNLRKGAIVVYESTVYPGVTEEVCLPILVKESGLQYPRDFKLGYSPERINPGDREHTLPRIVKVVSGGDAATCDEVAKVYSMVVEAGVYKAASIRTAEAAKVIENTQRDLNIALMNELSIIFNMMGLDTQSVLKAAGTKWNFVKMWPGLVGGHCIGVDPYYLTYKAESMGYHPQVILAGRRINDGMGKYVAEQTVKQLIHAHRSVKGAKALVLGITFKNDVSDIRNSKVIDVVRELKAYGIDVHVADPLADPDEVKHEYGLKLVRYSPRLKVDAVIVAVNHKSFEKLITPAALKKHFGPRGGILIDIKGIFEPSDLDSSIRYWRL